jgi:hypothetical protein
VADFNRDGDLDFAVANEIFFGVVTASLGDGHGGFTPAGSFSTAAINSVAIVAGDFNGDGSPDLATLSHCADGQCHNGSLSVLLGNGDGSFQPAVTYPIGVTAGTIAAGDLNGDGKLDLVASSESSRFISVFIGHGDGSFDPGVNYSTGPQNLPNGVALGDLNGDQKLDVIVANSDLFSSTVTVFLGNGDGTLGAKRSVVVDGDATAIVAGDFNGDRKLDVALTIVPSPDFQAGSVTILLGNGRGSLRAGATYTIGAQPSAIVAVDFDGAGTLDLAVANSQSSSVSVLGGNGDGTFKPVGNFAPGAFPAGIAVGNVNPDRLPDLLVVNQASDNVSLLIGSRLATLKAPQTFATGQGPSTVASGDFNHDGKADAAVINFYEETVSTYFGDGKGGLTPAATYPGGDGPHAIAVADINGDGNLDLILGSLYESTINLLFAANDGTFANPVAVPARQRVTAVGAADFNHDGKIDLVAGVGTSGSCFVEFLPGNGDGTFGTGSLFAVQSDPASIVIGDFNKDGNLDLAVANFLSNSLSVLLGNGVGSFQPAVNYPVGTNPIAITAGDLNDDGILDLAVANLSSISVTELQGNGDGTFGASHRDRVARRSAGGCTCR